MVRDKSYLALSPPGKFLSKKHGRSVKVLAGLLCTAREEAAMFDYIVVGGGSAGSVLAGRLSEDPAVRVCLLEAGPSDRTYWIRNCNPLNMLMLMNSRTYNWGYRTEPEARTGNRRFFWPRGRALGGSSSVNAMIYTRGHPRDYDHWASLGNPGWDYQSVLPWFRHSERQQRGAGAAAALEAAMGAVIEQLHNWFPGEHGGRSWEPMRLAQITDPDFDSEEGLIGLTLAFTTQAIYPGQP